MTMTNPNDTIASDSSNTSTSSSIAQGLRSSTQAYVAFQTISPSIANPYLCHMCSDGMSHCDAHQATPINLGQMTKSRATAAAAEEIDDDLDLEVDQAQVGVVGRSSLHVSGICCSSEVPAIRKILKPLTGVVKVAINITARTVYVDHVLDSISAQTLADALNEDKFGAVVLKDAHLGEMNGTVKNHNGGGDDIATEKNVLSLDISKQSGYDAFTKMCVDYAFGGGTNKSNEGQKTYYGWTLPLHPFVMISGFFWFISLFSFIPEFSSFKYAALISVLFGLPPIAVKAYFTMRRGQLDAQCNMFFAVMGAIALGELTEAAAVVFLFAISDFLEHIATSRARLALTEIVNLRPEHASMIDPKTKEIVRVNAAMVQIGDLLSVKTGEKVPCDGIIVDGSSLLDESSLTGEARPVKKLTNDAVSGGTVNIGVSPLIVRATSTVENSAIARLIQLVEEAQTNRSPTEKIVDAFAEKFTPIVVGTAFVMFTIPWLFGYDVGREWAYNGVVIIVIACPCALVISTPVTYVAGLAATAKRGVIIKGGSHLEALGRVKKAVFDKTGTLTEGKFALLHFGVVGNTHSYTEIMEYLAIIEAPSSHPLANALVAAAKSEGIQLDSKMVLRDHTLVTGEGVTANINGKELYVGNKKMAERFEHFKDLPIAAKRTATEWSNVGGTVGFVGFQDHGIVGIYCVADNIRPESPFVVAALQHLNIDVYLLTGDEEGAARAVARQVGIKDANVKAHLLPEGKMHFIESIKEPDEVNKSALLRFSGGRTLVMMCGDGVNDAPALAAANVGVSMGSGAAVAMETSNITLMDSNLKKLLLSVQMGKKVNRTIKENIFFSIFAKLAIIFITFSGNASLWGAIASDVGTMLIVTINGMKLLPRREESNDLSDSKIRSNNMNEGEENGSFVDLQLTKDMPEIA